MTIPLFRIFKESDMTFCNNRQEVYCIVAENMTSQTLTLPDGEHVMCTGTSEVDRCTDADEAEELACEWQTRLGQPWKVHVWPEE